MPSDDDSDPKKVEVRILVPLTHPLHTLNGLSEAPGPSWRWLRLAASCLRSKFVDQMLGGSSAELPQALLQALPRQAKQDGETFASAEAIAMAHPATAESTASIAQLLGELRPSSRHAQAPPPAGCEALKAYQLRAMAWMEEREASKGLEELHPAWVSVPWSELTTLAGTPAQAEGTKQSREAWLCVVTGQLCIGPRPVLQGGGGGILADEMGLGKTATTIAHIRRCQAPHRAAVSAACTGVFASPHIQQAAQHLPDHLVPAFVAQFSAEGMLAEGDPYAVGEAQLLPPVAGDAVAVSQHLQTALHALTAYGHAELPPLATASLPQAAVVRSTATLICMPSRIIDQWLGELQRWGSPLGASAQGCQPRTPSASRFNCSSVMNSMAWFTPDSGQRIAVYRGVSKDCRTAEEWVSTLACLAMADVVLVDYETLRGDVHYKGVLRSSRKQPKYPPPRSPLRCVVFWRLVLDEAQEVEGHSVSATAEMAGTIHAVHRWCVTGTPILRELQDLHGMLSFLRHQPLSSPLYWHGLVTRMAQSGSVAGLQVVRELLAPCFWRNTKSDVEAELDLPARHTYNIALSLGPAERDWYAATATEVRKRILAAATAEGGAAAPDLSQPIHALPLQLRADLASLRRTACHPALSDRIGVAAGGVLDEAVQEGGAGQATGGKRRRKRGRGSRRGAESTAEVPHSHVASSPDELMHKQLTAFKATRVQPLRLAHIELQLALAQWHWLMGLVWAAVDPDSASQSTAPAFQEVPLGASQLVGQGQSPINCEAPSTAAWHCHQAEFHARAAWGASQHVELWREAHAAERAAYRQWGMTEVRAILLLLRMFRVQGREEAARTAVRRLRQTTLHTMLRYAQQHCKAVRANAREGAGFLARRLREFFSPSLCDPELVENFPALISAMRTEQSHVHGMQHEVEVTVLNVVPSGARGLSRVNAVGTERVPITLRTMDCTGGDADMLPPPSLPPGMLQAYKEVERRASQWATFVLNWQGFREASHILYHLSNTAAGATVSAQIRAQMRSELITTTRSVSEALGAPLSTGDVMRASSTIPDAWIVKCFHRQLAKSGTSSLNGALNTYRQRVQAAAANLGIPWSMLLHERVADACTRWGSRHGVMHSVYDKSTAEDFGRRVRTGALSFVELRISQWRAPDAQPSVPVPTGAEVICLKWPLCVVGHPLRWTQPMCPDLYADFMNNVFFAKLVHDYEATARNGAAGLHALHEKCTDFVADCLEAAQAAGSIPLAGLKAHSSHKVSTRSLLQLPFTNLAMELQEALRLDVPGLDREASPVQPPEPILGPWDEALYFETGCGLRSTDKARKVEDLELDLAPQASETHEADAEMETDLHRRSRTVPPPPPCLDSTLWTTWAAGSFSIHLKEEDHALARGFTAEVSGLSSSDSPAATALGILDWDGYRSGSWAPAARRAVEAFIKTASLSHQSSRSVDQISAEVKHTIVDQFEMWDVRPGPHATWTTTRAFLLSEHCSASLRTAVATLAMPVRGLRSTPSIPGQVTRAVLEHVLNLAGASEVKGEVLPPREAPTFDSFPIEGAVAHESIASSLSSSSHSWTGSVLKFVEGFASAGVALLRASLPLRAQLQAAQDKLQYLEQKTALLRDGFKCAICKARWEWNGEAKPPDPALLQCGHVYCWPCINAWIQARAVHADHPQAAQRVVSCPECRAEWPRDTMFTFRAADRGAGHESALAYIPHQSLQASGTAQGVDPLVPHSTARVSHGRVEYVEGAQAASLYTPFSAPLANSISVAAQSERFGTKLVCMVRRILSLPVDDKVLVFTQWRSLLDLAQQALALNHIQAVQLRGGRAQKAKALRHFRTKRNMRVLLLCSDTDASGLTLISARHVIVLDPVDLPGVEEQAVSRCHRLGQQATCFVYRLLARDTMEEFVYRQQQAARHGARGVSKSEGIVISADERSQGAGQVSTDADLPPSPIRRRLSTTPSLAVHEQTATEAAASQTVGPFAAPLRSLDSEIMAAKRHGKRRRSGGAQIVESSAKKQRQLYLSQTQQTWGSLVEAVKAPTADP